MDLKTLGTLRGEIQTLREASYQLARTPNSTMARMNVDDAQQNIDIILGTYEQELKDYAERRRNEEQAVDEVMRERLALKEGNPHNVGIDPG